MLFPDLLTYNELGLFLVRLTLAVVFVYHALPKLKSAKQVAQMLGWSPGMVTTLGLVELLAGLSVLLGIYIQLGALLIALVMVGATWMKVSKWKVPFSAMDKMGWEFDLALLAMALLILFSGGGGMLMLGQ